MSVLSPLIHAPMAIQIHALFALVSLILGPVVLFRSRRDHWHRRMGYVWVTAMVITALSSFAIFEIRMVGWFSPIHLLSLVTLGALVRGVYAAINGRISQHRAIMRSLYFWSLGVAGAFTLLPDRIMGRVFFGNGTGGVVVLMCLICVVVGLGLIVRRRPGVHHRA